MANEKFVRISVDHIARQFPDDEIRGRWIEMAMISLIPFTVERGFDWELHVDETSFNIWLIQGMRPPFPNTEAKKWIRENRPVPYQVAVDGL